MITCVQVLSINMLNFVFSSKLTMTDDFDVEAMLEAPYRKEVSWSAGGGGYWHANRMNWEGQIRCDAICSASIRMSLF